MFNKNNVSCKYKAITDVQEKTFEISLKQIKGKEKFNLVAEMIS